MSSNIVIFRQKIKLVGNEGRLMLQEVDKGENVAKNSIDIRIVFSLCSKYFLLNWEVLDFLR